MKGGKKSKTIDEYLVAVGPDKRAALEKLRKAIQAAIQRLKNASAMACLLSVSTENFWWRSARPPGIALSTRVRLCKTSKRS